MIQFCTDHPDPATLPYCWCRRCGYFENGKRLAAATDENLSDVFALMGFNPPRELSALGPSFNVDVISPEKPPVMLGPLVPVRRCEFCGHAPCDCPIPF